MIQKSTSRSLPATRPTQRRNYSPPRSNPFPQVHSAAKFRTQPGHDKPTWYLITEDDRALSPAVQHALATQIRARSVALKCSHLSLVSHPKDVAQFIERAATEHN